MVCSIACAREYGKVLSEKKARKRKKEMKEDAMTLGDWLARAQTAFNAYIRERDKDRGCITCGQTFQRLDGYLKFDAGHYFAVGGYSGVRFDEDNVHGQCVKCNQHGHGEAQEYAIRLPKRIGQQRFEELVKRRNKMLEMTKGDAKVLEIKYKEKRKQLRNETKRED